jgi:hypothetical protein
VQLAGQQIAALEVAPPFSPTASVPSPLSPALFSCSQKQAKLENSSLAQLDKLEDNKDVEESTIAKIRYRRFVRFVL